MMYKTAKPLTEIVMYVKPLYSSGSINFGYKPLKSSGLEYLCNGRRGSGKPKPTRKKQEQPRKPYEHRKKGSKKKKSDPNTPRRG